MIPNGYQQYVDNNGQIIYIPITTNTIPNNNEYINYTNNNNNTVEHLYFPEPVITHQTPYPTVEKQPNYFSNNNVIYNTNTNQNNFFYDYNNSKNVISNPYTNANINYYPNNIKPTNPTNIKRIKPKTDIPSTNLLNPRRNILHNIDINEQNYPFKAPTKNPNTPIINNNDLILQPTYNVNSVPIQHKNNVSPHQLITTNQNNTNNHQIKNPNIYLNNTNPHLIKIPPGTKRDNIITAPHNNVMIQNNHNIKMPSPPNNTNLNAFKTEDNKIISNNIQKIPTQTDKIIIQNNNAIIPEKTNKETKIIPTNNPNLIQGNKTTTNLVQNNQANIITKTPEDKQTNKVIEEVTDQINNIEIVPQNTVKNRPLTGKDYDNIFVRGIGIINLGNTCFINSCLQALIHCKLFIHSFFGKSSALTEETTPISYNFLLICIALLDVDKTPGAKYIDISYFKYIFGKKHPIFNGYNQNDSQEFCRIFLEDLSNELNEVKDKKIYKALTNSEGKAKILRDKEFDLNFKEREKSIITDLFYSQIITSFTCQCGSEIYSFQKLLDFPLLLPENVKSINIIDLFKIYFKAEYIDFESKCERCNKKTKHKKEMKISKPPEILIISLQRINQATQTKNECTVTFPEILNIYDFIDHDIKQDKESDYQLFSIINHQGNINVGHYFTYVKPLGSKNWYEFNDSTVRKVKVDNNIFPYAYALFYIKSKYK